MIDKTTAPPADEPEKPKKQPPRRQPRELAPEERERILELHRQRSSSREIAKRLSIGRKIVRRGLDETTPKESSGGAPRPGPGPGPGQDRPPPPAAPARGREG